MINVYPGNSLVSGQVIRSQLRAVHSNLYTRGVQSVTWGSSLRKERRLGLLESVRARQRAGNLVQAMKAMRRWGDLPID